MKRMILAAALAAAGVATVATPASASHPLCTHMTTVEFVMCQLTPVTDRLPDGS